MFRSGSFYITFLSLLFPLSAQYIAYIVLKLTFTLKEGKGSKKKNEREAGGNTDMKKGMEGVAPLIQTCRSYCHVGMEASLNFNS